MLDAGWPRPSVVQMPVGGDEGPQVGEQTIHTLPTAANGELPDGAGGEGAQIGCRHR